MSLMPNGPGLDGPGQELELGWRSSRHARRLLTLSVAGVLIATLARRPEFAGVAAPALLLLAAGRVQRRPPRVTDPVGGTTADGARARFVISGERWGRRPAGTVDLVLRDRWRLAEEHATVICPG